MKKIMLIFILIVNFRFNYSISITSFKTHPNKVVRNINKILKNKVKFKNIEEKLDYNILFIKPKLYDLINNNKFEDEKNLKLFNKENLILLHLKTVQEQIKSFELGFKQTKEEDMWEIIKFTEVYDFSENLKIIDDFFKKNEEKTKNFLSNPDNCESKLLYKKYLEEIDFKKFKDAYVAIWNDMSYVKDLIIYNSGIKQSLIFNKINILKKVNDIRKSLKQNKLRNIEFNFERYDVNNFIGFSKRKKYKQLYEGREQKISNVQNIKLILNGKLKVEFDKLIEIMNKLENISEIIDKTLKESNNEKTENVISKIDLYKKFVDEFLNSLNLFFSVFNDKSEKLQPNSKDYGTSIILLMFKTILYNEKDIKSNVDYVFKTLLRIEELNDIDIKKIQTYWQKTSVYHNSFEVYISLQYILDAFCKSNDFILSEKNKLKFKEILSEDLNSKLKKIYDMFELFLDYLNTENHNIRKNMNFNLLQKIFQFLNTDNLNNEYQMFQDIVSYYNKRNFENSDIENLIKLLHSGLNYENVEITQLNNFEKYEIIFLSIIFNIFKKIGKKFLAHKSNILNILQNEPDMDISLKNLKDFISILTNLY